MAEYVCVNAIVVLCAFICWMVCFCVCPPMFVGACKCGAGKFIKTSCFMLMSPDIPRRVTLCTLTDNKYQKNFAISLHPRSRRTGIAIICTLEQFRTVCADLALVWNAIMLICSKAHVLSMKRQPQHHKVYVTGVSNAVKYKTMKNIRKHITEKNSLRHCPNYPNYPLLT